jgi:hypothetical protein
MKEEDFKELADHISSVVLNGNDVKKEIIKFRSDFIDMDYCFKEDQISKLTSKLEKYI